MERTSLITSLHVAFAADSADIHLVDGLPDSTSLSDYFTPCPFITEKAELTEEADTNDQGDIIRSTVRANIHRDETFHLRYAFKHIVLYAELLNKERIYLGSADNPVIMQYASKSGAAIADNNEHTLIFSHVRPV